MICSGCGKQISFSRGTCPECGRPTNSDQQAYLLSYICFGVLLAAGIFFGHALLGAIAGVASAFAAQIVHRRLQDNRRQVRTLEDARE